MNNLVIVSTTRTAVGKFGRSLKDFSPGQLGSVVFKDALKKSRWGAKRIVNISWVIGNGQPQTGELCSLKGRIYRN